MLDVDPRNELVEAVVVAMLAPPTASEQLYKGDGILEASMKAQLARSVDSVDRNDNPCKVLPSRHLLVAPVMSPGYAPARCYSLVSL